MMHPVVRHWKDFNLFTNHCRMYHSGLGDRQVYGVMFVDYRWVGKKVGRLESTHGTQSPKTTDGQTRLLHSGVGGWMVYTR